MSETAQYRAELLARLRNATDDLAWAVRGVTEAGAHYKPAPQEWSIHEHLSHVRDMEEQVYLPLLRWATVPDMLEPKEYSRHAWHQQRYRPDEPLRSILDDLLRMRDEELTIFRQLTDYDWTRYRTDTRWGPLTCQWIAEVMYRHTLDHLQCIMGLLQDLHLAALAPGSAVVGGYIGGEEGR